MIGLWWAACAPAPTSSEFLGSFHDRWCEAAVDCGTPCGEGPPPGPIVEFYEFDEDAARDCLRDDWGCARDGTPVPASACDDVLAPVGDDEPWWRTWLEALG